MIINRNIIVDEEYIVEKYMEQKGTQYSPLGHTFFNIQPVTFHITHLHPVVVVILLAV